MVEGDGSSWYRIHLDKRGPWAGRDCDRKAKQSQYDVPSCAGYHVHSPGRRWHKVPVTVLNTHVYYMCPITWIFQ
jgi:hypothetical protein